MSIFNQFPWTNFREYNLDWVIRTVKEGVANIETVVTDFFTDHLDNTLSISGDAADAAIVGSRLTTIGSRVSALEANKVDYYRFTIQNIPLPGVLRLMTNGDMTEAETAAALVADIQGHKPFVVMFQGVPADSVDINPNDTDEIIIKSSYYVGTYNTSTHSGTYVNNYEKALFTVVAIDDTASPKAYSEGSYDDLYAKTLIGTMNAVMICDSNGNHLPVSWYVDTDNNNAVVLKPTTAQDLVYTCAADGTITSH